MDEKKKVLIVSNDINETSLSLKRALNSLLSEHYCFQTISYGQALSELLRKIVDAFREIPQEFEGKLQELQRKWDEILTQRVSEKKDLVTEQLRAESDRLCKELEGNILSLQNDIDRLNEFLAKAYQSGVKISPTSEIMEKHASLIKEKESLINQIREEKEKTQNKVEEIGEELERQKVQGLNERYKKYRNIVSEMEDLISQIPEGAHTILLEQYWQDIIEKRGKGYSKLSQDSHIWTVKSRINSAQKAVEEVLRGISLMIILDPEATSDCIYFIRKYWAEIIRYKNTPPPVIFISLNRVQDLIEKDRRYFVLLAKGVEFATIPFSLKELIGMIQNNADKSLSAQKLREYIKQSLELTLESTLQHQWRNFTAPFSLLKGAYYVNDIDRATYKGMLKKLQERDMNAWREVTIYDTISVDIVEERKSKQVTELKKRTLSEMLTEKKVLLIDDEAKKAGWEETLKALFGNNSVEAIGEEWENKETLIAHPSITRVIEDLARYNLILLDLYLTEEDEKIKEEYLHGRPPDKEFSSITPLRRIREKDIAVPVILFTATTRHFNVEEAKKVKGGIDGYFQKEGCYQNIDRTITYYQDFKNLIEKKVGQENVLLRRVWTGIKEYETTNGKDDEVMRYLESAFFSLQGYIRENQDPHLMGVLVMLGSVVEKLKKDEMNNPYKIFNAITHKGLSIEDLYFFMARSIRGIAAHPARTKITLNDAFFAFFALLKALGVDENSIIGESLSLKGYCPDWQFTPSVAKEMIVSICSNACPRNCSDLANKSCSPSKDTIFRKAMFLSLFKNLTQESLRNAVIFLYLFYGLCNDELRTQIPPLLSHLIESSFTQSKFCPPFYLPQKYWIGFVKEGGTCDSPLGSLNKNMYKKYKEGDNNRIFFVPTSRYLRCS